jgi:hypothetical protein
MLADIATLKVIVKVKFIDTVIAREAGDPAVRRVHRKLHACLTAGCPAFAGHDSGGFASAPLKKKNPGGDRRGFCVR